MKTYDVVALGELLIDFTENGVSEQGNPIYEANPGGAPCNALAMLSKLGKKTAFIGKVGNDFHGRQLREVIAEAGIDAEGLMVDPKIPTTLAFVHTAPDGDRDFSFYRFPGADCMLRADEVPEDLIRSAGIFHFGSLSLTNEPVREATKQAVAYAKKAGKLVSFDPNLRPPLWEDLAEAKEQISWGMAQCDILKIADNEVEFLTGETDLEQGARMLRRQYPDIRLFNVTLGPKGSVSYYQNLRVARPSLGSGRVIETTGAGDTFCGSVLAYVLDHGLDGLTEEALGEMIGFASAAARLVTTRRGAIRSMPERWEVEAQLAGNN